MNQLDAAAIVASFVNCSRGEARRATLPDLPAAAWGDLDYLGWQDPSGSPKAWMVVPGPDGPVGLVLRQVPSQGRGRSAVCTVCLTPHSGSSVALTVATKAGPAGRRGDSSGTYLCRDLACSLYVRGRREPTAALLRETLPEHARVERLQRNLEAFVGRVLDEPGWAGAWDGPDAPPYAGSRGVAR